MWISRSPCRSCKDIIDIRICVAQGQQQGTVLKRDLIEFSNLLSSDHAPIQSVQQCRCLAVFKCQMLVISPNLLIELKMVQLSSQIHFVHLFIFGLFHYQIMSFQLSHMYQRSKLQFAKLSIRHILNLRCLMQYAY